jgi:hypothetical protein
MKANFNNKLPPKIEERSPITFFAEVFLMPGEEVQDFLVGNSGFPFAFIFASNRGS